MRLMVILEVDVSPTIAATMQRSGFTLAPDGTAMKVVMANCPIIPQRKTNVAFIENPDRDVRFLMEQYSHGHVPNVDNGDTNKK